MKFMKLGSKPDTFYTAEAGIRSVSCEVYTDLTIQVQGIKFLLHKFPLLSKSARLQNLCTSGSEDRSHHQTIVVPDMPGGPEAFELCAKFCYGIAITLSAHNLVAAKCAAEYLQMSEDVEKGNLMLKLEVFFNSCILHGWKDSIVTLQSTKAHPALSEDLGLTAKCIDAISSKVMTNPPKNKSKSWWGQDISELGIDLYWRTMIAIKSSGKVQPNLIGDALQIYASRWFPTKKSASSIVDLKTAKHRLLLEAIVSLLPAEKGTAPCSFLLKLLKAANKLGCSASSKVELARRAGIQLDEATVKDLLIPSPPEGPTKYDVDIVMSILDQFISQGLSPPTSPLRRLEKRRRRRSRSAHNVDLLFEETRRSSSASHGSKLRVAKLIDGYLKEIAHDANLPLHKMISIAESIPCFARVDHDDLYFAIDTYLKTHPKMSKSERKRLCRILDCKKMSMEACMEAAKNELLPLRVLVQVLFHEQSRSNSMSADLLPANIKALLATRERDDSSSTSTRRPAGNSITIEDQWSVSGVTKPNLKMGLDPDGSKINALHSVPARPKKMFARLLSVNRDTFVMIPKGKTHFGFRLDSPLLSEENTCLYLDDHGPIYEKLTTNPLAMVATITISKFDVSQCLDV
ncbi:uncharacterized protein [Phyllobates terribilis]|uniref:uncharacterized protein n=1 Tax=Phyllobates terribilis TaxID=111132 RepID=UPI003CCAFF21